MDFSTAGEVSYSMDFKPNYRMSRRNGSYKFQYYCVMCDYNHTTGWIEAGSEDEARLLAEKEARQYFNGCHKCGRWICDEHYNKDKMMCVDCAE
jgi:hypothetical protein